MDFTTELTARVIATLRAHEADLRAAGIRRLSLFGSVARCQADQDSELDLPAELDPEAELSLLELIGLEQRMTDLLDRPVDLGRESARKARLQASMDRDRRIAF